MHLKQLFCTKAKILLFFLVGVCVTLAGCAGKGIKERDLIEKTAYALWLPKDSFSISDGRFSAGKMDYVVTTRSGKVYDCYLTRSFTFSGRAVSDATCESQ